MKTLKVTKNARAVNALLDQARDEDLLIRAADGTEFTLTARDDFAEEVAKHRENKELMAFLDERRKEPATLTLEQVKKKLGLDTLKKRTGGKQRKRRVSPSANR